MALFRKLYAAPRRECGTAALVSHIRKASSQRGRLQTVPTPSSSQATSPANPRHHPPHRAHPLANSIPGTLASYSTHAVSLARSAAVSGFDVFARFMRFFRNVRGALCHWRGAVASAPSVHYVKFERDRTQSALTASGFRAYTWDSTRSMVTPAVERPGPDTQTHAAVPAAPYDHTQERPR